MELSTILIGALLFLLAMVYRHFTKHRGYLEALGIPMVKPFFIFGSPPYALHKVVMHLDYAEKFKTFGTRTYGRYEGIFPVVVTIDSEVVKSVLVKNFDSFTDVFDMHVSDKHQTLEILPSNKWRAMRRHLSPTFTGVRLKALMEPMEEVVDKMMDYVDELVEKKEHDTVDLKHVFQGLALSVISRCAFGIETDAFRTRDHPLIKLAVTIFTQFRPSNWTESLIFQAFFLLPGLEKFLNFFPKGYDDIYDITKDIIDKRVEGKIERGDFIARLMELVVLKREDPDNEVFKDVNEENIIAQGTIFFIAGYETTANTLSTFCYNMAKHPDIQERLHEEMLRVVDSHGGKINHETVEEMEILEAALLENLRLNGPLIMHIRLCTKDCEVVPGLTIKKGTRIDMPIYASHHDPEYFPNPEQFLPERFMKDNKDQIQSYTFKPFGGGPRVCIGQRFAMVEMKLALAKLILKYRIVDTPNTTLDVYKGDAFLLGYPDMRVKLELRKN